MFRVLSSWARTSSAWGWEGCDSSHSSRSAAYKDSSSSYSPRVTDSMRSGRKPAAIARSTSPTRSVQASAVMSGHILETSASVGGRSQNSAANSRCPPGLTSSRRVLSAPPWCPEHATRRCSARGRRGRDGPVPLPERTRRGQPGHGRGVAAPSLDVRVVLVHSGAVRVGQGGRIYRLSIK